jgi:hypothetical protein
MSFKGFRRKSLESRLRAERVKAPDALVETIVRSVTPDRARSPRGARLSFAGAVAVLVVGSFASLGGVSYAASAGEVTVHAVKQIVVHHHVTVHHSSAIAQYAKPSTNLGKPSKPASHTLGVTASLPAKVQGTLPFTGISLGITVAISLLLMGLGFALRRRGLRS